MINQDKTVNPNMLNIQDVASIGSQKDYIDQSEFLSSAGYHKTGFVSGSFSPQASSVLSGGYDNAALNQGAPFPYSNAEVLDNGSQGVHSESSTVSYGYNPHFMSRPYVPIAKQLSAARGHDHLYNEQVSLYQQAVSPNNYILSHTSVSQAMLPDHIDLQGDVRKFGLRSTYSSSLGSSSWDDDLFSTSSGLNFFHQGIDGGIWTDWAKPFHEKKSLLQLSSTAPSLKSFRSQELSGEDFRMASQQKEPFYGFGSCSSSNYRKYTLGRKDVDSDYESVSTSNMLDGNQKWPSLSEARLGGRWNDFSCSCTVTLDTISERNRGPRAFKPKVQLMENGLTVDSSKNGLSDWIRRESYSGLDFVTDYKDAKFFIIKSYSEDNVHKSIKYGVWASTANGNKRLDAAFHEAQEKVKTCPVFLLFSVNASAQFCGVAEMIGPVDFDKSVEYWLQDKWTGQFPVKWHIIKDVPNSQFRHILLENNDNKPVTNSRDTQEVELTHGIEMLKIFKNYEVYSSILDDFYFYEQRQRAMQERKTKHQPNPATPPATTVSEPPNPITLSNDFVKKMSKSFAEAVTVTEQEKQRSPVKKVVSSPTAASLQQGN